MTDAQTCRICGVLVLDAERHRFWHEGESTRLREGWATCLLCGTVFEREHSKRHFETFHPERGGESE